METINFGITFIDHGECLMIMFCEADQCLMCFEMICQDGEGGGGLVFR